MIADMEPMGTSLAQAFNPTVEARTLTCQDCVHVRLQFANIHREHREHRVLLEAKPPQHADATLRALAHLSRLR